MMDWQNIETAPEGKPILTKIDDEHGERNECILVKTRGMWWFEDKSMYVYYSPTHWKSHAPRSNQAMKS